MKSKTHESRDFIACMVWGAFLLYRAFVMDITNDEAYSFMLVDKPAVHMLPTTANTHWLNSFLLALLNGLFGHTVWILRWHVVLAGMGMAWVLRLIFKTIAPGSLWLFAASCILLNNYLVDFYSLARGYALALPLLCAAFYYLIRSGGQSRFPVYAFLSVSVLANFTSIYFLLAWSLWDFADLLRQRKLKLWFSKTGWNERWPMYLVLSWSLPVILYIKYVTGDLEEGQKNGFLADTLGVFIERSYPFLNHSMVWYLSLIWILLLLLFYLFHRRHLERGWRILFELCGMVIGLIHFNFYVLDIPFPFGRTSFFFVVPLMLLFCYAITALLQRAPRTWLQVLTGLMILFQCTCFMLYRHVDTSLEWSKQQGLSACFRDLYHIEKKQVYHRRLVMSIDHYGCYENYYRYLYPDQVPEKLFVYDRSGYESVQPQDTHFFQEADYLLMYGNYEPFLDTLLPPTHRKTLKHYPRMQSDLIQVLH